MKIEIRNLGQADFIVKDAADEIILGSGDHVVLNAIGEVLISEKLPEPVAVPKQSESVEPVIPVEQITMEGDQPEVDSHVA